MATLYLKTLTGRTVAIDYDPTHDSNEDMYDKTFAAIRPDRPIRLIGSGRVIPPSPSVLFATLSPQHWEVFHVVEHEAGYVPQSRGERRAYLEPAPVGGQEDTVKEDYPRREHARRAAELKRLIDELL